MTRTSKTAVCSHCGTPIPGATGPLIDDTDRKILRALQTDATTTHEAIGDIVHRERSSVSRRVDELQKEGVLTGLHATVDPEKLGLHATIFTLVGLKDHGSGAPDTFTKEISGWPNVVEYARIDGSWDFLLKFLVTGTAQYDQLHQKLLHIPVVARLRGMVAIGCSHQKPVPI